MKKFYITTPIYYPSGKPHIGHAYSTILADVFKRYKMLLGYDTFFMTGTDEHGKKIEDAAKKENMKPIEYVDRNVKVFIDLWNRLGIKYDKFIRTTDPVHMQAVQKVFSIFYSKNLIYLNNWTGLYCVSCEENYTLKDAKKNENNDLCCQHGHKLIEINEESYFFKMSEFQEWIKNQLSNSNFVFPKSRANELINNFLTNKLTDLSISRTSFSWGITINENNNHVIYVWMDALMNYITGLGYGSDEDSLFQEFWNNKDAERIHLIAKEITRFHCIYWPIFLHVLNLPLPTKIISHGWIITPEGKMSKSLGNVIDPNSLLDMYSRELIRYYFIKDMNISTDNTFSLETMIGTYNGDLANNYGNLISRSLGMLKKYCNNQIPSFNEKNKFLDVFKILLDTNQRCYKLADDLEIQSLLNEIQNIINISNKLIEETKPWELYKNNDMETINDLMYILFKVIESSSFWLQPILIDSINDVISQTNIKVNDLKYSDLLNNYSIQNIICGEAKPIFERIDINKELEKIKIKN